MCMPQISQFNNTQDIFKNSLKQDNLNGFTYVFQANIIIGLFCCAFGSWILLNFSISLFDFPEWMCSENSHKSPQHW